MHTFTFMKWGLTVAACGLLQSNLSAASKDGKAVEQEFFDYESLDTTNTDGTKVEVLSDGSKIIRAPDKTTIEIKVDGTKIIKTDDGSTIEKRSDGTKIIKKPNGVFIQITPDGKKTIKKPDGTVIEADDD